MPISDESKDGMTRDQQGYAAIEKHTPQWLLTTSDETRRKVREQGLAAIPWFTRAVAGMPAVVASLQDDYRAHADLGVQVEQWLKVSTDLEAFAEPLLRAALRNAFGVDLDVRQTWLFHPRRMQQDDSFLAASRDWAVEGFKAFRLACRPLLGMALQNFEAWESEPGGMDLPLTKARIIKVSPGKALWEGETLAIAPERFAAVCRTLDLGGLYQKALGQIFDPRGQDDSADLAGLVRRQEVFKRYEQSGLLLQLHLARMRECVGQPLYQALTRVLHNREASIDGVAITTTGLNLWDVELPGVLVFGADRLLRAGTDRIVVYIPGDPDEPWQEHASFLDFCAHLRDRLLQAHYLDFFKGLIPLRHRARLLGKLHDAFHPRVWNPGGWYEQVLDREASLPFRERALDGVLMATLLQRKIAALMDDGLFIAVPTAAEDHKSQQEKLEFFAQAGLMTLNALAFAVPVIGTAMLVFGAAQLAHEVYEGIGQWTHDERGQAWDYLFDVVENLALMAALGAAGQLQPGSAPRALPSMPENLHPLRLGDGNLRLWSRDLAPFAHDIVLPEGLRPDARGLYEYQGRQWLTFDKRTYAVAARSDGSSYIRHPWRADAHQPALHYHGEGVWLHELDRPREWSGLKLFRRLGAAADGLDEREARQLLLISGCHEAALRRTLVDGQRPPALLMDSLERYRIHRELTSGDAELSAEHYAHAFDRRYHASLPTSAAAACILRDFSSLPQRIVDELLAYASPEELALLEQHQRIAQRIAEEARLYLQSVRLARAYEGLYVEALGNADSTRLGLHSLPGLPGWSARHCLEIRALRRDGPLLDSIGPPVASPHVLVRSVDGYRHASEPGLAAEDLFGAVLRTLTPSQREALGIAPAAGGQALRRKVLACALGRPALRKVLHMQPVRPAMRSPMRLADGRPGYPLSGRPGLPPVISENTVLDKIRLLELPDVFARDLLLALRNAGLGLDAIDARLDTLLDEREQLRRLLPFGEGQRSAHDTARNDRQAIEHALWEHWQENLLPEIGRTDRALRFSGVSLASFPEELPDFLGSRVQALELSGVVLPEVVRVPGEDGVLRQEDRLLQWLRHFPEVSRLRIDGVRGRAVDDVPRVVVEAFPRLVQLRLLNLQLPLTQNVLDEIGRLSELRHLDLSGNRPGQPPVRLAGRLQLDVLGLDRLGLEHWPEWLDGDALNGIRRLSLCDNRLSSLPAYLYVNPEVSDHATRIVLRGNPFSWQALIGLRTSAWRGRRFTFDLSIPQALESLIRDMMLERETLSSAVDGWLQASRASSGLSEERLAARRSIGASILQHWVTQMDGFATTALAVGQFHLEDFPDGLPDFYFNRIRRLELTNPVGSPQQLNDLIARFASLQRLEIRGFALDGMPAALTALTALRHLAVTDAGLVVDQQLVDVLGRMPALTVLELGGNRLGEIRDVSTFSRLLLTRLGLDRMEITQWPAWLDGLLPERILWLNLNHNRLTALPVWLLENAQRASGSTEIALEGNPLSEEVMYSAYLSEGPMRPFTFQMDLPEDFRRLDDSWRGSSSMGGSSRWVSEMELIGVEHWLDNTGVLNETRRQIWQQLESGGEAEDLLQLIGRLRYTAEYRNPVSRPDLQERVWQVLTVCARDAELRLMLNGMAEEPLRQVREADTCSDGIRLEFNQMEVLVFTEQALRATPVQQRGAKLYQLMRRLYRLNELDRIARLEADGRDEAEVRLAYRLNLANRLDLPLAPEQMLFAAAASLRNGELERAAARVLAGEAGREFLDYAAQRDFWLGYLQDAYAQRFTTLREAFEGSVLALDDLYPDDLPVQSSARIQTLIDQRKRDERALVDELTRREGQQAEQA